jgi:hypothetical protein
MYFIVVIMLLLVLPAASVILESTISAHGSSIMGLIGKWYVFWAGGVRLLLAGLRQVSQPRFTASEIFDLDNVKAFPIVREIGFGNLAMGTLAICTIFRGAWLVPAAMVVCLYYGLAGLGHPPPLVILRSPRAAARHKPRAHSRRFGFAVLFREP